METPIEFNRGNIVSIAWGGSGLLAGVVLEVDYENAAEGGKMNYHVALIWGGEVVLKQWYSNDDLTLLDDGTAGEPQLVQPPKEA